MIDVVCAIIERGEFVLVARRGQDMRHPWKWEFPGGKVDQGESKEEALHRELAEELQTEVNILEALEPVEYTYPDLELRLWPFRCEWARKEPIPDEHAETVWLGPENILGLELAEADIEVATAYLNRFYPEKGGNIDRPFY